MGSSSRRSVVSAGLTLLGAAGFALAARGWFGAPARPVQEAPPAPRLRLGLVRGQRCLAEPQSDAGLALAAWLTQASLSPRARASLLDTLESITDRLEARLNPFAIDFGNEPIERQFQRELTWFLPSWRAARSLARRCFAAGDGTLMVTVPDSPHVELAPEHSFDAFTDDTSSEIRQARFLAWPICHALRVCAAAPNASSTWQALRERCASPDSQIALVVDARAQAVQSEHDAELASRLAELRQRLSKFDGEGCKQCTALEQVARALRAGPPLAPALPWLELSANQALIVPRLSAISDTRAFTAEVLQVTGLNLCSER